MRAARTVLASLAAGAAIRVGYLLWMALPVFDPWRHLLLIANLRAGKGFTLFQDQPYIWYASLWYRIVALFPSAIGPEWIAGALSALSVALLALWLSSAKDSGFEGSVPYAAAVAAAFGPLVAFTCHYGPEAFALACLLSALVIATRSAGTLAALAAGLLFGAAVCARLSLAFDVFLFLPALRKPKRVAALAAGTALPLALQWLHNHRVLASLDYVFLWDGLAVRTSDFNPLTTLFLQGHPSLSEALRRLHATIVPWPEWIANAHGIAWGPLGFMVAGIACTLASRRIDLILAAGSALAYFLIGDRTHSSNFFRLYLGVFPAFFAAIGIVAARLSRRPWRPRWARAAAWGLPGFAIVCGLGFLKPPKMYPVEMVTPPPEILDAPGYMVSCGMYQPESFMWRFPDKQFIGLPLDPSQFADFHRRYPAFHSVIWHAPNVQQELGGYLVTEAGFTIVKDAVNEYGVRYGVLEESVGAPP